MTAPDAAKRPVPGDSITFPDDGVEGEGFITSIDDATREAVYTDGVAQECRIPLGDLRPVDPDIDPDGVMGWYALPVGYVQWDALGDDLNIVCPDCAEAEPDRFTTREPVYRPEIVEGELCAALGTFNHPECHELGLKGTNA